VGPFVSSRLQPSELVEPSQDKFIEKLGEGKRRKYERFVLAALSSIPWVGGVIGAAASLSAEKDQEQINDLQRAWLEEHKQKIADLGQTLTEIFGRLDGFGDEIKDRLESKEYLSLVRRVFRSWDVADTQDKRQMLKKLITNAGAIKLCPDDLIRLFANWIDQYHEAHFLVIKEIFKARRAARGQIWDRIHDKRPREDSAEADLFKYLIRDLSTGGVIRQERSVDYAGRFIKKDTQAHSHDASSRLMESAFENTKPYVLTELGKQFVHYVMEDVVPQLGGVAGNTGAPNQSDPGSDQRPAE